jgi:glyoxylase-like metal-dependent hydrolase (beta-lactamase superfamily II)
VVAEVAPGLYRLPGVREGVNAFVWHPRQDQRGEGEPILFDCGWPWSGRGLVASLVALGCRPAEVRTIAITHHDFDHTGRLAALQAASGATVIAHSIEAERLSLDAWRPLPGPAGPVNWLGLVVDRLYGRWAHYPVRVDRTVEDGDELPGGWIAVHTPGHTPGHTSYFHPQRRLLIAGDSLGPSLGGKLRAPVRMYTEDPEAAVRSIQKLAALEPEVICCGHRPVMYNGARALRELTESFGH